MKQVYSTVEDFISKSADDNIYWSSRADDIGSLNGIIEKQDNFVVGKSERKKATSCIKEISV